MHFENIYEVETLEKNLLAKKLYYQDNQLYIELFEDEKINEIYVLDAVSGKNYNVSLNKMTKGYSFPFYSQNLFSRPLQLITQNGMITVSEKTDVSGSTLNIHNLNANFFIISKDNEFDEILAPTDVIEQSGNIKATLKNKQLIIENIAEFRDVALFIKNSEGYYFKIATNREGTRLYIDLNKAIENLENQTFTETFIYFVEDILEKNMITKVNISSSSEEKQYVPLISSYFLLFNGKKTKIFNNKQYVETIDSIFNYEDISIKNKNQEFIELTDESLSLLPPQTFQLFKSEKAISISKTEENIWKQFSEVLGNYLKIFNHGKKIFVELKKNKVPTLINDFSKLTINAPTFEEIFLEDSKSKEKILLAKENDNFTLDLLKTSLNLNREYNFLGKNIVTKDLFYLNFISKKESVLGYTILKHSSKTKLITYDYDSFIEKNYPIKIASPTKINHITFVDKFLHLTPEKALNNAQLVVKHRGVNEAFITDIISEEDNNYYASLAGIEENIPQNTRFFADFYIQMIDKEKINRFPLELKKELINRLPGKMIFEKTSSKNNDAYKIGLYINKDKGISLFQEANQKFDVFMKKIITTDLDVPKISLTDNLLKMTIPKLNSEGQPVELKIINRGTNEESIFLSVKEEDNIFSFDLSSYFIEMSETENHPRVDLRISSKSMHYRYDNCKLKMKKAKRKEGLLIHEIKEDFNFLVYTTKSNIICGVFSTYTAAAREYYQVQTKLEKFQVNKKQYDFSVSVSSFEKFKVKSAYLKLRSKEYNKDIPCSISNKEKNTVDFSFKMDPNKFFPLYWDLFLNIEIKNITYPIKVKGASKEVIQKVEEDYLNNSIISSDKTKIIYPYVTFSKDIAFMIREKEAYENNWTRFKDKAGYMTYKMFKKHFDKKNIWLGFEKFSQTAQDNGFAMFNYVQENNLNDNYYYVLSKDSKDYEHIKNNNKNILPHMSYRYFIMLYAAKLLIASETPRHVHNIRIRSGRASKTVQEKKSVFLQHGVTGFKKSDVFKKSEGRGNFNLVVATSEIEKEILHENWLYDEDEIAVTGFSRWDLLEDSSQKQERKRIFVMPTWRSWMEDMPKDEFINTDYYHNYMGFLSSERLFNLLEDNNMEIVFFLHPKFKGYISEFEAPNNRVKLYSFGDIKVNEMIMSSSIMISDYSSATWDMFYLDKPVLFFQFDHEKYESYEGSYLNMDEELFGPRAFTVEQLITEIERTIANNFALEESYEEKRKYYFKYHDRNNSKRIYEKIIKERVDQ